MSTTAQRAFSLRYWISNATPSLMTQGEEANYFLCNGNDKVLVNVLLQALDVQGRPTALTRDELDNIELFDTLNAGALQESLIAKRLSAPGTESTLNADTAVITFEISTQTPGTWRLGARLKSDEKILANESREFIVKDEKGNRYHPRSALNGDLYFRNSQGQHYQFNKSHLIDVDGHAITLQAGEDERLRLLLEQERLGEINSPLHITATAEPLWRTTDHPDFEVSQYRHHYHYREQPLPLFFVEVYDVWKIRLTQGRKIASCTTIPNADHVFWGKISLESSSTGPYLNQRNATYYQYGEARTINFPQFTCPPLTINKESAIYIGRHVVHSMPPQFFVPILDTGPEELGMVVIDTDQKRHNVSVIFNSDGYVGLKARPA
ncbi:MULTISPECIES: hypothetical protein [unclassified Pseudomonas]|uniref:hypothetical protein n=1 Tax=unclassified Pseudomonas TaxID=196821 RepID=UPI002096981F|nr:MULTISPECIES: hypothetical protein [unclassified Pseudomonas]MCO7521529.1 hypothetical protein [Pseudomonas sp. 1]MCO7543051.1 hypothetical protein [Pseudomonas sp. VA159-2]